jgi:multidrug efflux pump subunit AcrA (membrane-fusion protein)
LLPKEEEALAPPLAKPKEVEYKTQEVQLGDISKETLIQGKFRPKNEVTLSFEQRGGILLSAEGKYGQKVSAGDLLFALDIEGMDMELRVAGLNLEKAQLYYDRVKSRTSSTYDRRMAQIDLEIKQIAYDKIALEIEKSRIYAPVDGIITYLSGAEIGEYIDAKKIMAKVAGTDELRLMVSGDDALKLDFGEEVFISFTIDKQKYEKKGEVVLSPLEKPENSQESFEEPTAIIEVKGFDTSKVAINKEAKITIVEQSAENVIVIRRSLIKNYFGRTFVYVLEDGVKVERDVDVGITSTVMAEIREGLQEGDLVIIN